MARLEAVQSVLASDMERVSVPWLAALRQGAGNTPEATVSQEQAARFMRAFTAAIQHGEPFGAESPAWEDVRVFLKEFSRQRAVAGMTPAETATFIFSLKEPLFNALRANIKDMSSLMSEVWEITQLLDALGLFTFSEYQRNRETVIVRQQHELLELSTPVVRLWDGIVALPLIGTLDSERAQIVTETLLNAIVDNEAQVAIIDITGVPTVDTMVAQHLLKTVAATRLMGAECVVSGIRPQIAQTLVHLGVDLSHIKTRSTLADALKIGLQLTQRSVISAS